MSDTMGHNAIAAEALRAICERIIRLHEERKALADDIADIFREASSNGYDKDALKSLVKIMMEPEDKRVKRQASDDVLGVYLAALGIVS